jgi:hypothetical protein
VILAPSLEKGVLTLLGVYSPVQATRNVQKLHSLPEKVLKSARSICSLSPGSVYLRLRRESIDAHWDRGHAMNDACEDQGLPTAISVLGRMCRHLLVPNKNTVKWLISNGCSRGNTK